MREGKESGYPWMGAHLAKILNGSEKQFEVTWNSEAKAIELVSNTPYTEVGGELAAGDGEEKEAALNSSTIYKDEVEVELLAYTINDNNYFKLRDVAEAFDIGVTWDGLTKTVGIDTSIGYEAEESTEPVEEAEEAAEPVEELEEPAEEIEAEEEALVTIKSASIVIDPAGIVVEFDGPIPASLAGESYASLYYPDYHKDYVYSPFEMSPAPWEIGFSLDLVEGATEYTISLSGEGYEEYEWPGTGKYELSLLDQVINLELTEDSLQ